MAEQQADPPSVADIAARWLVLEQLFSRNGYDGGAAPRPADLAGQVMEPVPGLLETRPGRRSQVVVTASHATNHERAGARKVADRGTGGLALLLAELTGATALIALHTPGDANFDAEHPLKTRLAQLRPAVVIDLHGMRSREGSDLDLGAGDGLVPDSVITVLRRCDTLAVTLNKVFDAMRPTTVTAYAQGLGIPAVQAEIGAHLRPPAGSPVALGRLALLLASAVDAGAAPTAGPLPLAPTRFTRPASTVQVPSGVPSVVVPPDMLHGTTGPVPVTVSAGGSVAPAWAWSSTAAGMPTGVQGLPADHFGLTRRLSASLDAPSDGRSTVGQVTVTFPATVQLRPVAAFVDDLPAGDEVQVSDKEFPGAPRRYLLIRGGVTAWVTAVPRSHVRPGTVRTGYQLRLLTETEAAENTGDITLVAAQAVPESAPRTQSFWSEAQAAIRAARLALDQTMEVILRFLFRAPSLPVRVVQAHPGDDSQAIVALHPAVFTRIGVEPGQQVLVRWGPSEVVAVAVEDHDPPSNGPESDAARRVQRVNRLAPSFPAGVGPYVVARLSASVRLSLDAPVATVVSVRRRMRPILVSNLNTLVIPLASLVVASAALKDPNWWLINAGTVAMSVFALARLRIPRPRTETRFDSRWPRQLAAEPVSPEVTSP